MNKLKHINLSKGGGIYYARNNVNRSTCVELIFDCGARCDTIAGLAHFVEHMFFSGTKTLSREEVTKKYFNFIGSNAFTSFKTITFDATILTKEFAEYIKTVAMLITESTFKQSEVDKECGIIKQEIARKKDKQQVLATYFNNYNLTNEDFCKDYGALGTEESVSTIKSKDIKNFVKKYFVANNLSVIITTPLKANKVKSIIEKELISKLPVKENFKPLPTFEKYAKNTQFVKLKTKNIGKNYININFVNNHNIYDLKYLATKSLVFNMINDISTGVLKTMREEKSLVYSASIYNEFDNDKQSIESFYTECATKNVNAVIETLAEYIQEICTNGFTESQFKQARRMFKYNQETKQPYTYSLINKLSRYKRYGKDIGREMKRLKEHVTLEDCNNVVKEIFKTKEISMSVYGEITKKELITEKQFKNLFLK